MRNRWYLITLALAVIIGIAGYAFLNRTPQPPKKLSVNTELAKCTPEGATPTSVVACSRQTIRNLLSRYSTKELLENIATSTVPAVFLNCHPIGHLIGEETYVISGNLESALSRCTNACSNSCIHGALGAAVADELGAQYSEEDIAHADLANIEKIGEKYCTEKALCHGMGHLLFLNSTDFMKSLKSCDKISKDIFSELCYQGVFMQGVGGLSNSLIAGGEPPPLPEMPGEYYAHLCATIPSPYRHACFMYLPRYEDAVSRQNDASGKENLATMTSICKKLEGRVRSECFEGIGRGIFFGADARVLQACTSITDAEDHRSCILGTINILSQYNNYSNVDFFCASQEESIRPTCYSALFQYYYTTRWQADGSMICKISKNKNLCASMLQDFLKNRANLPDYRYGLYGKVD